MDKKVLIISYYFPPNGGAGAMRALKFLKYLPSFGWEPFIVTVKNPYSFMEDHSLEKDIKNSDNIYYTKALLIGNFFRRFFKYKPKINFDNKRKSKVSENFEKIFIFFKNIFYTCFFCPDEFIGWIPFAVIKSLKVIKEKNIDIIVTSGPPNSSHLIGLFLKKITGIKWIMDCRDLWNQYYLNYNPYNIRIKTKLDEYMEHKSMINSDKITVVTDMMKEHFQEKFPDIKNQKIVVITNGYDPQDFENIRPVEYKKEFVIIHYGTLFRWRKPDNFLKALKNVIDKYENFKNDILVVFMGIMHRNTLNCVNLLKLDSYIKIINYKPYFESLNYLKGADLLMLITGELVFNKYLHTLKLFDYIGIKKPILALTKSGALKDIIEEYSLGVVVDSDDIEKIEEAIYKQYIDLKLKNDVYKPKDCSVFHRKYITDQLAEIMDGLTLAMNRNPFDSI